MTEEAQTLAKNSAATSHITQSTPRRDWRALFLVLIIIVVTRELTVWVMGLFGLASLGNLAGLFVLLALALIYRHLKGNIPHPIVQANSRILKESLFAFLPICAGGGVLLVQLGHDAVKIVGIMLVSTLIPLALYLYWARRWL